MMWHQNFCFVIRMYKCLSSSSSSVHSEEKTTHSDTHIQTIHNYAGCAGVK